MKEKRAAELIDLRLKYNWIVQLVGLACVFLMLFWPRFFNGFLIFAGIYFFIEFFCVSAYRNLKAGKDGFHSGARQTLDQDSGTHDLFFCFLSEFFLLMAGLTGFFIYAS